MEGETDGRGAEGRSALLAVSSRSCSGAFTGAVIMSIQYKFFTVFLHEAEKIEGDLNCFLRSVRVIQVQRQFVDRGDYSFWALAVEYMAGTGEKGVAGNDTKRKPSIDYKQVLSPEDFNIFAQLREWRKVQATEDGTPVYTIFTNEQLAKIVENRVTSKAGLLEIDGVGEGKISKYGLAVLKVVQAALQNIGEEGGV